MPGTRGDVIGLIHTDFFSRGMCLQDIFFSLEHSARNFLGLIGW